MKKTSIYLEPDMDEALARLAAENGLTKAEFIRRGLATLVSAPKRPKPSVGVFASGDGRSVSEDVDAYLTETGFGEQH